MPGNGIKDVIIRRARVFERVDDGIPVARRHHDVQPAVTEQGGYAVFGNVGHGRNVGDDLVLSALRGIPLHDLLPRKGTGKGGTGGAPCLGAEIRGTDLDRGKGDLDGAFIRSGISIHHGEVPARGIPRNGDLGDVDTLLSGKFLYPCDGKADLIEVFVDRKAFQRFSGAQGIAHGCGNVASRRRLNAVCRLILFVAARPGAAVDKQNKTVGFPAVCRRGDIQIQDVAFACLGINDVGKHFVIGAVTADPQQGAEDGDHGHIDRQHFIQHIHFPFLFDSVSGFLTFIL